MTITGKDELSLFIMDKLSMGTKLKDIPREYGISLDQAKRLSRYQNVLKQAEQHLTFSAYKKVKDLGLKSLYLAPLFRVQDWLGVEEILSVVTKETKRDDLTSLLKLLEEKRERVDRFQRTIEKDIRDLNKQKQSLETKEHELEQLKNKAEETTKELNIYPKETRDFLLDHVGVYNNQYCLIKRVDSLWSKILKKNAILKYDEIEFVQYILDIDNFAQAFEQRIKRGGVYWDYDKEVKRNRGWYDTPKSPYYKNGDDLLGGSLKQKIMEVEQEIKKNKNELRQIEKQIEQLKKTSVKSFMEAIEASNKLSSNDLKKHGEAQNIAAKWLYSQGFVVALEVTLPNGKRIDVVGFNAVGHIVAIEVKVNRSDFIGDAKWEQYLNYCDEFFFCFPNRHLYYWEDEHRITHDKKIGSKLEAGLLLIHNKKIKKTAHDVIKHEVKGRNEIMFLISRFASRKMVYGY